MPELPEVETVKESLKRHLLNKKILSLIVAFIKDDLKSSRGVKIILS